MSVNPNIDIEQHNLADGDQSEKLTKDNARNAAIQAQLRAQAALLLTLSSSSVTPKGGHDASSGSYPSTPSEGDAWVITTAGTISSVDYELYDVIAYLDSSWELIFRISGGITVLDEDDFASDSEENPASQQSTKAYFSGSRIKTLYEGESNTNAYTDAEKTKLAGVASGAIANLSEDTTPDLGGDLGGGDNQVSRVNLKDYGEITNAIGSIGGGTQDIDLELGNSVTATVDTSTTTFTFSNPTASDEKCGFTLKLTNGGSQTVNWPASVEWPGGTAPDLTAAGVDKLVFETEDGGTSWQGNVAGLDYS